jgi:hypothetical protein
LTGKREDSCFDHEELLNSENLGFSTIVLPSIMQEPMSLGVSQLETNGINYDEEVDVVINKE